MHPTLIDLGWFRLPSYGVMIALAVIIGLATLKRRADRAGMDGSLLVDVGLWLVIWALVGAKVLLVLVELPRYLAHPAEILGVLRSGGVFLGGFIAAVVAAVVLVRRHRLQPLATLDVIVPSLALGQAIGRVGCLLAGCCWGASCALPWAIVYTNPQAAANVGTPLGVALHPWPAYASLFNFGVYLVLAALYSRRVATGRVLATYLLLYGVGRFSLEYLRGDALRGFVFHDVLSTSQAISVALIAAAAGLHLWISSRRRPAT